MIELYEQSLEYVKQAENQEVLDFLARRLYDMTADILMSLLIIVTLLPHRNSSPRVHRFMCAMLRRR